LLFKPKIRENETMARLNCHLGKELLSLSACAKEGGIILAYHAGR